jgi:hypothetical protein
MEATVYVTCRAEDLLQECGGSIYVSMAGGRVDVRVTGEQYL